jgi:serine/threonine-protein kinase
MAAPFDHERLEITGDSAPVLEGVRNEGLDFTISRNGTVVYVSSANRRALTRELVWVDHEGKATPLKEMRRIEQPRVSPDGQNVALDIVSPGSTWGEIFIYNLARDTLRRLTFDGVNHTVLWTPDGERVVFDSNKDGPGNIFWTLADGSGPVELLFGTENSQWPGSFSSDGQVLAFVEADPSTGLDIWTLPMNGDRKPQPFQRTPAREWGPMFSPDGRWIAYVSNESGRDEVYVRPYPESPGKWQISNDGGRDPAWSPDGDTLFYRTEDKMMAVAVMNEPSFTPEKPELLFEGEYLYHAVAGWLDHDISVDGQSFLMIRPGETQESAPAQVHVILNWFEELKRLVPTDN